MIGTNAWDTTKIEADQNEKPRSKLQLNARDKTKIITIFSRSDLSFSYGIIAWIHAKLENLNILTRTQSTKYHLHHSRIAAQKFEVWKMNRGNDGTESQTKPKFQELF